jgi:formylglycine-generating enzyme required for sulfatase activity
MTERGRGLVYRKPSMQKVVLIFIFVCGAFANLSGQKNSTKIYGTVAIDSVSSMDATEVTITEWISFLINNNFKAEFFPDPSSISNSTRELFEDLKKGKNFEYFEIIRNNDSRVRENYGDMGFRLTKRFNNLIQSDTNFFSTNIPIVGISFAQAKAFCEWRESVVNKYKLIKVSITLPAIEVYEKVIENRDSVNPKGCYMQNSFNCHCFEPVKPKGAAAIKNLKSQGKSLTRADSYWPSALGLYGLQGNAAEMTATEGIAMGGSFRDYAIQSFKENKQNYSKPGDWLGFRCLVTLK